MTIGKKLASLLFILLILAFGLYPFGYLYRDESGTLLAAKGALAKSWLWRGPFFAHIFAGGLTLLSGWPQFISSWRERWPQLHRRLGQCYVVSVAISGVSGLRIAVDADGGWMSGLGFGLLSSGWLVTTFIAYRRIRERRWQAHREWMIRSFALALAAVTLRLQMPFALQVMHLEPIPAYRAIAWLCWIPNLLVAEVLIRNSHALLPRARITPFD